MKLLKYLEFINENFDLQNFFKKEKITADIQEYAKKEIDRWFSRYNNVPVDVNKDKLILWFARNISNILKKEFQKLHEDSFRKNDEYGIYKYQLILNYLNGKKTFNSNNEEENYEDNDIIIDNVKNRLNKIRFFTTNNDLTAMQDYIFSNVRNENIWKIDYSSSFEKMIAKSKEWHDSLKASGSVTSEDGVKLIEYPDGFYWIDLLTNNCKIEGNAMGHCGATDADTILSLRQKKKDGTIEPFVTIAINYKKDIELEYNGSIGGYQVDTEKLNFKDKIYGAIYQCKGKNNKKPIEKYHKYIIDLYIKYDIGTDFEEEYMPQYDFEISDVKDEKLINLILAKKPNLIPSRFIFYKNEFFTNHILKNIDMSTIKIVSNLYYIMEKNYISKDEFIERANKLIKDTFVLKDDKLYLYLENKSDSILSGFSFMYEEGNRDLVKTFGEIEWYGNSNFSWKEIDESDFNQNSIDLINKKIDEVDLDPDIRKEVDSIEDWKEKIDYTDALDDIKDNIIIAYNGAQDLANESEAYDEISKPLFDYFGIDKFLWHKDGVLFPLNKDWLINYDSFNDNYYGCNGFNLLKDWFGDDDDDNDRRLSFNIPYYGWYGTIDKDTLLQELEAKL